MMYSIRTAGEKDSNVIYDYICLLEEQLFNRHAFELIFRENIQHNNCICLVAESDTDQIIGFINCHIQNLLHHCGKVAEIMELYVEEDHRSRGVGYHLLTEMETRLSAVGCLSFEVTAQNKRHETHRFYERFGFQNTHQKFVKLLT